MRDWTASTIFDRSGLQSVAVHPSAEAAVSHASGWCPVRLFPPRGNSMPLYMYQASYTAKSMADQLKEP